VIQALRAREGDDEIGNGGKVAVTAPTGIAATNVSGVTIHSWAGVGLAKGRPQTIIDKVLKSSVACARWRKAVVLVIDEVSMLDSELFDILEATGRAVRGGQRPFGGLQIVTCGDFYQLPPVKLGEYGKGFAFQVND
jgi:ATP-dependent DNA helicase PIF1